MDAQEQALCTSMHNRCIAMARMSRLADDPMHAHWLDAAAKYRQLLAWSSARELPADAAVHGGSAPA
jgi:hypothetical protein